MFKREMGIILGQHKKIIHLVYGNSGLVVFPQQLIFQLQQDNPGQVFCLSHTHPPKMPNLSSEDESTLKANTMAYFPYPMRMEVISQIDENGIFGLKTYIGLWESKESWLERGKTSPRIYHQFLENSKIIDTNYQENIPDYMTILIRESYGQEPN